MITPPQNTPSYYTALFNEAAAVEVAQAISPQYAADAAQVLVTSLDLSSDLHAIGECQSSVNYIAARIGETSAELKFNPIYLPAALTIDQLEVDDDGEIKKIGGFTNSLVTASLICKKEEAAMIEANVCFKSFNVPPVNELVRAKRSLMS